MDKLNAATLKETLWDTLKGIKSGQLEAAKGDAIAAQAREILRTIKTQISIMDRAKIETTSELKNFAVDDIK